MNKNHISLLLIVFVFSFYFQSCFALKQDQCPNRLHKLGPYGGTGGIPFDDGAITNNELVNPYVFKIRSDRFIDNIQIIYKDQKGNSIYGGGHGGNRGFTKSWVVPEGEKIVKAIIYSGAWVDSIQFFTDEGTPSPKWGGTGGSRKEIDIDGLITSIYGKSGAFLDQIGFTICKIYQDLD